MVEYDIRNVFLYLMFSVNSALTFLLIIKALIFMTNKKFVKEVRIKVEFSELSQKAFTKMKQF